MDSDLLPLERFPQKYNLSHVTIWKYRRAGLPTLTIGRKIFIRESAFVAFAEKNNGKTISAMAPALAQ